MTNVYFKCIRNDSKTLPFAVNGVYTATNNGDGYFWCEGNDGSKVLVALNGKYLEFVILP
jgi:hypothetical protein